MKFWQEDKNRYVLELASGIQVILSQPPIVVDHWWVLENTEESWSKTYYTTIAKNIHGELFTVETRPDLSEHLHSKIECPKPYTVMVFSPTLGMWTQNKHPRVWVETYNGKYVGGTK